MDNSAVQNIAEVIAIVVGVSLALTQAVGGLVTYLVDALKGTGKIKDGYSGVVAIIIGILLGMGLAGLADGMADESYSLGTMLLLGAFAGALMAAGSIKTFKAMGQVNPPALTTSTEPTVGGVTNPDIEEAVDFMQSLKAQYSAEQAQTQQELGRIDQLGDHEIAAAMAANEQVAPAEGAQNLTGVATAVTTGQ